MSATATPAAMAAAANISFFMIFSFIGFQSIFHSPPNGHSPSRCVSNLWFRKKYIKYPDG